MSHFSLSLNSMLPSAVSLGLKWFMMMRNVISLSLHSSTDWTSWTESPAAKSRYTL